jgi:hypothetical protein
MLEIAGMLGIVAFGAEVVESQAEPLHKIIPAIPNIPTISLK